MKPPALMKEPASIPHLEIGDEVYFRHATGPMSGKVAAFGKHGCTLQSAIGVHKAPYDTLLGHKVRVTPELKLLDEGEDGFVAADPAGRRRYFHDPITAEGEEPAMAKSLFPRILLFAENGDDLLKAIKGAPGLALKNVTDKAGHQTRRWTKTAIDLPKVRSRGDRSEPIEGDRPGRGSRVVFTAGDFKGGGKVVGKPGKDGAQVKDESGRLHGVAWSEMKPDGDKPDAGGTDAAAKPGDAATPKPAATSGGKDQKPEPAAEPDDRPPFPQAEIDSLPKKVDQPVNTWEALQEKGAEGLAEYRKILGSVASELGLRTDAKPDDLGDEDFASDDGFLFIGSLKGEKRAREKVAADYSGDWSKLRDMVRATISVSNMSDLRRAVRAVEAKGLKLAQKPNDRFTNPTPAGYRDLMTIVRLPNGMLAELQYHLKGVTAAKSKAHHHYEEQRSIVARNKAHPKYDPDVPDPDAPQPFWSKRDVAAHSRHQKAQQAIYGPAYEAASKKRQ